MRASLLLSSVALGAALLLTSGRATAQVVDSTSVEPPKQELNALPPDAPTPQPTRPRQVLTPQPQPQQVTPPPATDPGTFQPARPAQPNVLPQPAKRPIPGSVGKTVETVPIREKSKWFVTGNPDLGFGGGSGISVFNVGLSALFGYRLTDRFAIGPGLTYQYSSIRGNGFSTSYSNVGARVFGQAIVTENIFVHAEAEALRTPSIDRLGYLDLSRRVTIYSQFAGLGYRQHISERAAFDIMVLYNFAQFETRYLYGQPEFRFNLLFDLGK